MKQFILIFLPVLFVLSCGPSFDDIPIKGNSLGERLTFFLEECEQRGFSGSILIEIEDSTYINTGYGESNRATGTENTEVTVFDIGSVTKQFTGAGVLKLNVNGLIELSDEIGDYLPTLNEEKAKLTIHQLLTHTSGLRLTIGKDEDQISKADFIEKVNSCKLKHQPGEQYLYSNVGYTLLAMLIEEVSGKSYEQYMRDTIFLPANMQQTGYVLPDWSRVEMAIGYRKKKVYGRPDEQNWNSEGPSWHLKGNGGILSTVNDMYLWHQALLGSDILDEDAKALLFGRHTTEGDDTSFYGYGWAIVPTTRGTELITHNGGNNFFFADFLRYEEEDVTIIVLANDYNVYAEELSARLSKLIFE